MMKERLLQRVDELIEMANDVLSTRYRDTASAVLSEQYGRPSGSQASGPERVDHGKMTGFRTVSLSFIQRVYGDKHTHYAEFRTAVAGCTPRDVEIALGILQAIRGEIDGDWLFEVRSLVTAEVFTDYMDMAEYLLGQEYKDSAAVIAGSTLEEHLRQLCRKNGLPVTRKQGGKDVPVKADQLNADLTKAAVYNSIRQKQVTAWLGIRNSAAHGKYDDYGPDDVKGMIAGIIDFMASASM